MLEKYIWKTPILIQTSKKQNKKTEVLSRKFKPIK